MQRRFVILDRDGTLNVERHYLSDPNNLELLPNVGRGLRSLRASGMGIVVATNQSAIARGFLDNPRLEAIHERLHMLLAREGITLDGIYVCPHHQAEGCRCRKPAPGLIEQAVLQHGFDPKASFMVGDRDSDIGCGRGVGAFTILVRTGYGKETELLGEAPADAVVDDLAGACRLIQSKLVAGWPVLRPSTAQVMRTQE